MSDPYERETIISYSDGDPGTLNYWTARPQDGRKLEKLTARLRIPVNKTSRPSWEATLPISCLKIVVKRKPRILTDEQRAVLSERMKNMRRKS